jgi:hypothetical protein
VSAEIANMVQNSTTAEGEEITIENINESVQNVLNQSDQEIIAGVNIDDIKIKKFQSLKSEKRKKGA